MFYVPQKHETGSQHIIFLKWRGEGKNSCSSLELGTKIWRHDPVSYSLLFHQVNRISMQSKSVNPESTLPPKHLGPCLYIV